MMVGKTERKYGLIIVNGCQASKSKSYRFKITSENFLSAQRLAAVRLNYYAKSRKMWTMLITLFMWTHSKCHDKSSHFCVEGPLVAGDAAVAVAAVVVVIATAVHDELHGITNLSDAMIKCEFFIIKSCWLQGARVIRVIYARTQLYVCL